MNPFNLNRTFDTKLSKILLNLKSHLCHENIKDLFVYLPDADIDSDIQVILKVLYPYFNSSFKLQINKVLYYLLKAYKNNTKPFDTIKIDWILSNYADLNNDNQKDSVAQKIFDKYFSLNNDQFALKLEKSLDFKVPSKDLPIFSFLIKNSKIDHYFNIGQLSIQSVSEMESLYEILKFIKGRNPIEILKIKEIFKNRIQMNTSVTDENHVRIMNENNMKQSTEEISINRSGSNYNPNNSQCKIALESLIYILGIRNTVLLNHKYAILINIYDLVDDSVYEESKYLNIETLKQVCEMKINISDLKVNHLDQLLYVCNKLKQVDDALAEKYAINNINENMCVFDIIEQINIDIKLLDKEKLRKATNKSIKRHVFERQCECSGFNRTNINVLKDYSNGKYKIAAYEILKINRNPNDFDKSEIEEQMKYSIRVFPKEYFLSNVFHNASASFFLKEYPEYLADQNKLIEIKNIFRKTQDFEIADLIKTPENLKMFFMILRPDEIYFVYKKLKNIIPDNLKIVYLYFLWFHQFLNKITAEDFKNKGQVAENNNYLIDYKVVFDCFLNKDFLRYLISKSYNLSGFFNETVDYIKNFEISSHSILSTGYNFDSRIELVSGSFVNPRYDIVMLLLDDVLGFDFSNKKNLTNNLNCDLLLIYNIIRLINYKAVNFLQQELQLKKYFIKKFEGGVITIKEVRNYAQLFGKNSCYCERVLLELYDLKETFIGLSFSRFKLIDLILRHSLIDTILISKYINPTYLSHEALNNCVRSIIENTSGYKNLKEFKYVLAHGSDIDNKEESFKIFNNKVLPKSNVNITLINENQPQSSFMAILNHVFECDINLIQNNIADPLFDEFEHIKTINDDDIFNSKDFRDLRYDIYKPLIDRLADIGSDKILNLYSFTKGDDSKKSDGVIFNFITSFLNPFINCYWLMLINSLKKLSNIQIVVFVEKYIMKLLDDNINVFEGDLTSMFQNVNISENTGINILSLLQKYLSICTVNECTEFSLVFPNLFIKISKLEIDMARNLDLIKNYVEEMTNVKVNNGKLSFSQTNEFYRLRLIYMVDAISHEANVYVPHDYPLSPAKIKCDEINYKKMPEGNVGSKRFLLELQSALSRNSKFVEVLMMWKVEIDNHIAGFSECLICFFVLEPRARSLPEFKCPTCANNFHNSCIYKWTSNSEGNLCPFCRSKLPLWK